MHLDLYIGFMDEEVNAVLRTLVNLAAGKRPVIVIERKASFSEPGQQQFFEWPITYFGKVTKARPGDTSGTVFYSDESTGKAQKDSLYLVTYVAWAFQTYYQTDRNLRRRLLNRLFSPFSKTARSFVVDPAVAILEFKAAGASVPPPKASPRHSGGVPIFLVRGPEMGREPELTRVYLRAILQTLRKLEGLSDPVELNVSVFAAAGTVRQGLPPGTITRIDGSYYVGAQLDRETEGFEQRFRPVIRIAKDPLPVSDPTPETSRQARQRTWDQVVASLPRYRTPQQATQAAFKLFIEAASALNKYVWQESQVRPWAEYTLTRAPFGQYLATGATTWRGGWNPEHWRKVGVVVEGLLGSIDRPAITKVLDGLAAFPDSKDAIGIDLSETSLNQLPALRQTAYALERTALKLRSEEFARYRVHELINGVPGHFGGVGSDSEEPGVPAHIDRAAIDPLLAALKIRALMAFQRNVSLTIPEFGGADLKEAAATLGLVDVAMEDYHVLRVAETLAAASRKDKYPTLAKFELNRLEADPPMVGPVVPAFEKFKSERQYSHTDYAAAVVWGLRGVRLADFPRYDRVWLGDWTMATYPEMPKPTENYLYFFRPSNQSEARVVLDPFFGEIATDLLATASRGQAFGNRDNVQPGHVQELKVAARGVYTEFSKSATGLLTEDMTLLLANLPGQYPEFYKSIGALLDAFFKAWGEERESKPIWVRPDRWDLKSGGRNQSTKLYALDLAGTAVDRALYKSTNTPALQILGEEVTRQSLVVWEMFHEARV